MFVMSSRFSIPSIYPLGRERRGFRVLGVAVFVTCKYPIGKTGEIHWKIGSLEKREKREMVASD